MYAPVQYAKPQLPQGLSVTSLVTGIVGAALAWAPFFGFLLPVIATIFGAIGLSKALKNQGGGKGLAITGLVLGILSILLCLIMTIGVLVAASSVPATTV